MVTLVPRALEQIFYACDHKQQFFQIGNNFYTQTSVAPLKSSVWIYTIIPKRFPHLKIMAISSFRIAKKTSRAVTFFSRYIKTCVFFGKGDYTIFYTVMHFSPLLIYHRNTHTHDWMQINRRTERHYVHIHAQSSIFPNPFDHHTLRYRKFKFSAETHLIDTLCPGAGGRHF